MSPPPAGIGSGIFFNLLKVDAMQGYKVITTAENTGLDLAVFPCKEDAKMAVELAKPLFDASFDVVETREAPNTTYGQWVAAGW